MDSRLVTVVSVAVVLLSAVQGMPQEASAEVVTRSTPLEYLPEVSALDKRETPDKLKVHFPEDSKQAKAEDEDSVRSPRQSPSMSFGHNPPHTTTVCIQVRSDMSSPQVVCGPQVDEKREGSSAARFSYPEYYPRAQYSPPSPVRYSPPSPVRYAQQAPPPPQPTRMSIYPVRRREEEIVKPVEQVIHQAPVRVIPSAPPTPMVLHRQYYQPVVSAGVYPQASQLLRLNCGVQPEGQFYNSPLLRGSSSSMMMGYYPVGEQMIALQDGSSILGPDPFLPRAPGVFSGSLRPRMSEGQGYFLEQESPYAYSAADPWSGALFPGEDAFYSLDGMQGRSAGSGEEQQYPDSVMSPEYAKRKFLQEQELMQSRQRLSMLQGQLRDLHQRSSTDEDPKSAPVTDGSAHETSPDLEQKKDQATRTSKRHTRPKST